MAHFSDTSKQRLATCDPRLQKVMNEVIKHADCKILCGHRTQEEQDLAYIRKNSKVQWPNSKHNTFPSKAIDVAPYPIPKDWGAKNVKELVKFYQLTAIILYEAKKQGVKLRTGMDWDMDGDYTDQSFDDVCHIEVVEG